MGHHACGQFIPALLRQRQVGVMASTLTVKGHAAAERFEDSTVPQNKRIMQQSPAVAAAAAAAAAVPKSTALKSTALMTAQSAPLAPPPLHCWVWLSQCSLCHLPTTQECTDPRPKLSQSHRDQSWIAARVCLAAIWQSHGAYERAKVTLLFGGGVQALTFDKSLCYTYLR
jgi:hypothetical protein